MATSLRLLGAVVDNAGLQRGFTGFLPHTEGTVAPQRPKDRREKLVFHPNRCPWR